MSFWTSRAPQLGLGLIFGLAAGAVTAVAIILIGSGIFWLYVFGDDPWPSIATTILTSAAYLAGLLVFMTTLATWLRRPIRLS